MKKLVIKAENLTKRFGSIVALDSVSVDIPEGTTLIMGPNGGGKSTFFKLATGVLRPTSGRVRLLGRDPWRDSSVKMRVGVSYDPPAFPKLVTGEEWLELFARAKGYGREEVERVAGMLGIDYLPERTGNYSSGMLKKLSVAQAFIGKPELVMIDEPLANVDFETMASFVRLIRRMKGNTSFVLISHIWEPLLPVIDWIVVIANGRIVLSGKADELKGEVENLFRPDFSDLNEPESGEQGTASA